jgi:hypothetical protein
VDRVRTPVDAFLLARLEANEIYVSEFRNNRVQRFSAEGKVLASFAVAPMPGGLAVDRAGNVKERLPNRTGCRVSPLSRRFLCRPWPP